MALDAVEKEDLEAELLKLEEENRLVINLDNEIMSSSSFAVWYRNIVIAN